MTGIDALGDDVDMEENDLERKPSSRKQKRKMGVFSAYYNFYFEVCKRLKQRMKENKKNFKFRKIYNRSKSAAATKVKGKTSTKKIIRKKQVSRSSVSKSKVKAKADGSVPREKKLRPRSQKPASAGLGESKKALKAAKKLSEKSVHAGIKTIKGEDPETPPMKRESKARPTEVEHAASFADMAASAVIDVDLIEDMVDDDVNDDESMSLNCDTDYGGELDSEEIRMLEKG